MSKGMCESICTNLIFKDGADDFYPYGLLSILLCIGPLMIHLKKSSFTSLKTSQSSPPSSVMISIGMDDVTEPA